MTPALDARSAARILDLAESHGSRSGALMGFALILLLAAHAALTGGFPQSAQAAAVSPAGVRIHARESAQMNRLMAISAAAVVTAGASAQNAVQWRVEDGGNGHWYQRTASVDPPSWNLARQEAERLGGFLVTIHSEAENAIVRALVEVSGATHVWIGCRFVDGLGWRWIDGTSPGFTAWGGSNCLVGPYPNDPPYVGSAVAFANCVYTDTTSLRVWDDFPIVPIGYSPFPSIVEFSADCNADGIVDYGQIRSGEFADSNANNIPDCCESGPSCDCPGDTNSDGSVDGIDLATILTRWAQPAAKFPNADCNRDGVIDGSDLAIVLGAWGGCP